MLEGPVDVESEIRRGDGALIEAVRARDGSRWIRRTYDDDKREIFRALASIKSSHLPEIASVELTDSTVVIERYIEGTLLSELIASRHLDRSEIASIARQLMTALSDIESRAIVHRDIKPANIIIDKSGRLYLIDFNIARICRTDITRETDTTLEGTRGYAPPEQFGFGQTDARSDIYAVGRVIQRICRSSAISMRDPIARWAGKCASLDPNDRYDGAPEALAALAALDRRRSYTIAAAVMAAAAAAIFIAHLITAPRAPEPADPVRAYRFSPIPGKLRRENLETKLVPLFDAPSTDGWDMVYAARPKERWSFDLGGGRMAEVELAIKSDGLEAAVSADGIERRTLYYWTLNPFFINYTASTRFGEVMPYDIDHDGTDELFIAINDSTVLGDPGDPLVRHPNWSSLFCFFYVPGEGMYSFADQIDVGEGGRFFIDPRGSGLIAAMPRGDLYTIKDHKLQRVRDAAHRPLAASDL